MRFEKGKGKIRSWRKMEKKKLKAKFLPSYYLQDHYIGLYNLR